MSESKSVLGKRQVRPSSEQLAAMSAQMHIAALQLQQADAQLTKVRRTRNLASLDHRRYRDMHEFWSRFVDLPAVVYGHPEWAQCIEVQGYRLMRYHMEGVEAIKKYSAARRLMVPTVSELTVPTHIDKEDLYGLIAGVHVGNSFYLGCPELASNVWHTLLNTAELKRQYDSVTLSNHSSYHVLDTLDVEVDSHNKDMRLVYDAHAVLHVWIRDDLIDPILTKLAVRYVEAVRQNEWIVASQNPQIPQSPPQPKDPMEDVE